MRNCYEILISLFTAIVLVAAVGCATTPRSMTDLTSWMLSPQRDNPVFVPVRNYTALWDTVEDVLDDYYVVSSSEPVRFLNGIYSEGRIATEPRMSATLLEPWYTDSVTLNDRMERTFQTIRSRALVRVTPVDGGASIQVFVYNELENLSAPMGSNVVRRDVRFDQNQDRVIQTDVNTAGMTGWIFVGRDNHLEQQILRQIVSRLKTGGI